MLCYKLQRTSWLADSSTHTDLDIFLNSCAELCCSWIYSGRLRTASNVSPARNSKSKHLSCTAYCLHCLYGCWSQRYCFLYLNKFWYYFGGQFIKWLLVILKTNSKSDQYVPVNFWWSPVTLQLATNWRSFWFEMNNCYKTNYYYTLDSWTFYNTNWYFCAGIMLNELL